MDKEIQHIETLSNDLQTSLNPVDCRCLEELRRLEGLEQTLFILSLRFFCVKSVENIILEEFLVTDSNLYRLAGGTMFKIPLFDQWDVLCTNHVTSALVEWVWRPP